MKIALGRELAHVDITEIEAMEVYFQILHDHAVKSRAYLLSWEKQWLEAKEPEPLMAGILHDVAFTMELATYNLVKSIHLLQKIRQEGAKHNVHDTT